MGFSGKCSLPENVLNAYTNEEIGLLPRGGVALYLYTFYIVNKQQHFGHFIFKIRYKFSDKFLVYMMVGQFGLEFICP
jgi:hypothetical protein